MRGGSLPARVKLAETAGAGWECTWPLAGVRSGTGGKWRPPATGGPSCRDHRWSALRMTDGLRTDGRLLVGLQERVQLPIEDGLGVAGLEARAVVLHHLVGVEDVGADLVAPAGGDVLPLETGLLLRL